jgi:hypothetical protein
MVATLRLLKPTAYLEQQPGLLFGFAYRLCESGGLVWRRVSASVSGLRKAILNLLEESGANKRGDNHSDIQRSGNDAATWLNSGIAAAILTSAAFMVEDGSASPRSIVRCWSHGGRSSP